MAAISSQLLKFSYYFQLKNIIIICQLLGYNKIIKENTVFSKGMADLVEIFIEIICLQRCLTEMW
jgi:hypothetical protein